MYLIVGLGNPGSKYAMNRHNVGFMIMDTWMKSINAGSYKEEHKSETKRFKLDMHGKSEEILVMKPQTFMNLSGQAVQSAMAFYKIPLENILIVHDEVDIAFGALKFQKNRSAGGQNGVKNITELLGTQDYARLRVGVGRPPHAEYSVADWVLGNFPKDDHATLEQIIEKSIDGIECFIFKGLNQASTDFNGTIKGAT